MIDLPTNPNLIVCLTCAYNGTQNIFGELEKDAKWITTRKGPHTWKVISPEVLIKCGDCDNLYNYVFEKGVFLTKPLDNPPPTDKFYAITLTKAPGGTI